MSIQSETNTPPCYNKSRRYTSPPYDYIWVSQHHYLNTGFQPNHCEEDRAVYIPSIQPTCEKGKTAY